MGTTIIEENASKESLMRRDSAVSAGSSASSSTPGNSETTSIHAASESESEKPGGNFESSSSESAGQLYPIEMAVDLLKGKKDEEKEEDDETEARVEMVSKEMPPFYSYIPLTTAADFEKLLDGTTPPQSPQEKTPEKPEEPKKEVEHKPLYPVIVNSIDELQSPKDEACQAGLNLSNIHFPEPPKDEPELVVEAMAAVSSEKQSKPGGTDKDKQRLIENANKKKGALAEFLAETNTITREDCSKLPKETKDVQGYEPKFTKFAESKAKRPKNKRACIEIDDSAKEYLEAQKKRAKSSDSVSRSKSGGAGSCTGILVVVLVAIGAALILFYYGGTFLNDMRRAGTCELKSTSDWYIIRNLTQAGNVVSNCRLILKKDAHCRSVTAKLVSALEDEIPLSSIPKMCHESVERESELEKMLQDIKRRVWDVRRGDDYECFPNFPGFISSCFGDHKS
ncbi:hypothetical protein L596_018264 [Steinernema carpocapsae]|uniref:Uncharacterized protein n=1 Tax=Steinernema carpocapsae TaxID=34508 RepID=A0A4U5N459_STECR|nr:hypothetical protein L596_018264 [Steinernema carpocapsae]